MKWLGWFFDVWFIPMVLIFLCLGILFHFALIIIYGKVVIEETDPLILGAEIATVCAVAAYSTLWLLRKARRSTKCK